MQYFIEQLNEKLKQPLPGAEAQYSMAHVARRTYLPAPPDARKAGVLALFYPENGVWNLVFIERTSGNPNDRHSGQISFPGGQYDPADGNLVNTALREAYEEIGAPPETISLAGKLTELYIPVSNFLVYPVVGYTPVKPAFRAQAGEVASILEVPFSCFLAPETVKRTDITVMQNLTLRDVPYFDVGGKVIWGATAMILGELRALFL